MSFPLIEFIEKAKTAGKSKEYINEISLYINNLEKNNFTMNSNCAILN